MVHKSIEAENQELDDRFSILLRDIDRFLADKKSYGGDVKDEHLVRLKNLIEKDKEEIEDITSQLQRPCTGVLLNLRAVVSMKARQRLEDKARRKGLVRTKSNTIDSVEINFKKMVAYGEERVIKHPSIDRIASPTRDRPVKHGTVLEFNNWLNTSSLNLSDMQLHITPELFATEADKLRQSPDNVESALRKLARRVVTSWHAVQALPNDIYQKDMTEVVLGSRDFVLYVSRHLNRFPGNVLDMQELVHDAAEIFFYNSLTIRDLGKANSDKIRLSDGKDVRSAQVGGRKRDMENLLKEETALETNYVRNKMALGDESGMGADKRVPITVTKPPNRTEWWENQALAPCPMTELDVPSGSLSCVNNQLSDSTFQQRGLADSANEHDDIVDRGVRDKLKDDISPSALMLGLEAIGLRTVVIDEDQLDKGLLLGEGSSASVFKTMRIDNGCRYQVAVKVVRRHKACPRRLLLHEAKIWRRVQNHKNILPLHGVATPLCSNDAMLVSAQCKNGDLQEFLRMKKPPRHTQIQLLADVASAIAHLHNANVFHGDLRAQNILVDSTETALLCDFGCSAALEVIGSSCQAMSLENIRWLAFELIGDGFNDPAQREIDEHTDVYSFGCVMLEVFSGREPHCDIESDKDVLHIKREKRHPNRVGGVENEFWNLMMDCWQVQRDERISAEALHQSLVDALGKPPAPSSR